MFLVERLNHCVSHLEIGRILRDYHTKAPQASRILVRFILYQLRIINRQAALMNTYNLIFALVVSRCCHVLAQQPCYWLDGTEANDDTVSCYSSQDSVCCWPGEVCLSNGLCFSPQKDTVRLTHFSPLHDLSNISGPSHLLIETGKTYRGACTAKIWSNTTVCPTQFCPRGKVPFFIRRFLKATSIEPSSLDQIQTATR